MALISADEQAALTQAADQMCDAWQQICDAKRLRQPVPRSAVHKVAQIAAVALRIAKDRAHDAALLAALEAWLEDDQQ